MPTDTTALEALKLIATATASEHQAEYMRGLARTALRQIESSAPSAAVSREFTNELGNAIRITIEGPTSVSENILTPMEFQELRAAINSAPSDYKVHKAAPSEVFWAKMNAALPPNETPAPSAAAVDEKGEQPIPTGYVLIPRDPPRRALGIIRLACFQRSGSGGNLSSDRSVWDSLIEASAITAPAAEAAEPVFYVHPDDVKSESEFMSELCAIPLSTKPTSYFSHPLYARPPASAAPVAEPVATPVGEVVSMGGGWQKAAVRLYPCAANLRAGDQLYTHPPAPEDAKDAARNQLALAVINAARTAMDESFEAGNAEKDIAIPSHWAASLSLCLDEYDAALSQGGSQS